MKAYGIPCQIIKAVNIMYMDTEDPVLYPDGDTGFFLIKAGVFKWDILAHYFFI